MPILQDYFTQRANKVFDEREQRYRAINTPEKVREFQKQLRGIARDTFGSYVLSLCASDSPPKVLKAGTMDGPGVVIEKFLFEVFPKFWASAVLYRPVKKMSKCPALVMPVGHWWGGKATPMYQRLMRLLAARGVICASFDSCGAGERIEWFSPVIRDSMQHLRDIHPSGAAIPYALGEHACHGFMLASNVTSSHNLIGDPGYLCGVHLNALTAVTGKRLVDLLMARKDVDAEKIGACGASGGGTDTRMLCSLDERLALAIPTSILGSDRALSGGDCDQSFFFTISRGISHIDLIACMAPKPVLIISSSEDKHNTAKVAGFYRPFWDAFGKGDQISSGTGEGAHGFPHESRKIIAEFVLKHLRGETVAIPDDEHADALPVYSTRELSTTFIGNVWMDGIGKGPVDVVRDRVSALSKSRPKIESGVFRSEVLRTLFESEESLAAEPQNVTRSANEIKWEGEGGVPLRIECIGEGAPQILFAHEHGVDGAKRSGVFAALRETGLPFGMIDVRGTGISAPGDAEDNGPFLSPLLGGRSAGLGRLVLHQSRSLIGMRTIDLLVASRVLNTQPLDLLVEGAMGFAAMFAAFLKHSAYRRTILYRTPLSCAELATAADRTYNFAHFPFGILERFDLPDVTAAIPEGKLVWINPANGSGKVLQAGTAKKVHGVSNIVWKHARVQSELARIISNAD